MEHLSATRTELLARRAQITLADQGRELLAEKRAALMREFDRLRGEALEAIGSLERAASAARSTLGEAVALEGPEPVVSASLAAGGEVELELRSRSVAGVALLEVAKQPVARGRTERGYSLPGSSARIDLVGESFEALLDELLDTVPLELTLRRLASEIETTTRRVNALEHVVLPRLEGERDWVAMVLEERELEERVRLMRARSNVAGRRGRAA